MNGNRGRAPGCKKWSYGGKANWKGVGETPWD